MDCARLYRLIPACNSGSIVLQSCFIWFMNWMTMEVVLSPRGTSSPIYLPSMLMYCCCMFDTSLGWSRLSTEGSKMRMESMRKGSLKNTTGFIFKFMKWCWIRDVNMLCTTPSLSMELPLSHWTVFESLRKIFSTLNCFIARSGPRPHDRCTSRSASVKTYLMIVALVLGIASTVSKNRPSSCEAIGTFALNKNDEELVSPFFLFF